MNASVAESSSLAAMVDPDVVVDLALGAIFSRISLTLSLIFSLIFARFLQHRPPGGLLPASYSEHGSATAETLRTVLLWVYYYVFIHLLYYGVGGGGRVLIGAVKPTAETLKVQGAEARGQMDVSEMAFPLYCCVPVLGDVNSPAIRAGACGV